MQEPNTIVDSGTPAEPDGNLLSTALPLNLRKGDAVPAVERYLIEGRLPAGEIALSAKLKEHPHDDQLRFGLGVLQFLRAVEHLSQNLYRFGVRSDAAEELPFLRIPVPKNPHPESLSYEQARNIIRQLNDDLEKCRATLAGISDPEVKLPLHFGLIRLDVTGRGKVVEEESLWRIYAHLNHNHEVTEEKARGFFIKFDRGDVHWLRGYCHLLMSVCNVFLAYDSRETFECTGHLFFANVNSPYKFLRQGKRVHKFASDFDFADFIAFIHLIRWQVVEPERMEAALHHLEAVVAQSKESWKWIMAEKDDDHEWLPNPRQTGVIPGVRVTEEMVTTWQALMGQLGKILSGERLIPFWRGDEPCGVNLRRVFLEPRTLDLVLWVQGPAAAPYLERGKMVEPGIWRQARQTFGSNFPGFALWFN